MSVNPLLLGVVKLGFFERFLGSGNFLEGVYKDIHDRLKIFADNKITKKAGNCVSPNFYKF
jgi:hypothetical protein